MVEAKVFKNSAIYTLCNFLTKALNFLLLPLYTAYLTTADYGITGLTDSFKGVMCYVGIFSVQAAVMRFYIDYKDDANSLKRYVGTLFSFGFLSTFSWIVVICLLQQYLSPILFQGVDFTPTILIALVGLLFGNVSSIFQELLRGMENAKLSAQVAIGNFFLTTALTVLFIVPLGLGANGVLLASAISSLCFFVFAVVYLRNNGLISFCLDFGILKGVLAYSVPLMPHNLSTSIASLVSTVLINGSGSLAAVGIYNLASKFGVVCDTLQSSVSTAYQPWLFRMLHDRPNGFKEQIRSFTETLLWFYALVFVALGLFIQELVLLFMNNGYGEAWMLVPFIIGVYSIKTVYYFYIGILFYYKEAARFIFVATLSSSVLNVVTSFLFIPVLGAYGSVLADGVSMVLRVGLVIFMCRKYDDCGYRLAQFAKVTLAIVAVLVVGLVFSYTLFQQELSILNISWKIFVFAAFAAFVCFTHKDGVKTVAGLLKSKFVH